MSVRVELIEAGFEPNSGQDSHLVVAKSQRPPSPSIRLSNEFVAFHFLLDGPGAIVFYPAKSVDATPNEAQGASSSKLRVFAGEGPQEIAPLLYQLIEPQDGFAGFMVRCFYPDLNLSLHTEYTLGDNDRWLSVRTSVLSRGLFLPKLNLGLELTGAQACKVLGANVLARLEKPNHWLALHCEPGSMAEADWDQGLLILRRFEHSQNFLPAYHDSFSLRIELIDGLESPDAHCGLFTAQLDQQRLLLIPKFDDAEAAITLQRPDGESFRAPASLQNGVLFSTSVEGIGSISRIGVETQGSHDSAEVDPSLPLSSSEARKTVWADGEDTLPWSGSSSLIRAFQAVASAEDPSAHAASAVRKIGDRAGANLAMAIHRSKIQDWELAIHFVDEALAFEAQSAILWWFRAALHRCSGHQIDETPDWENAHFLAPLDPLLRCENALHQPLSAEHATRALLEPLGRIEVFAWDAAATYFEFGLERDAMRLADEFIRIEESFWLRLLLCLGFAKLENKVMEASMHLEAARRKAAPAGQVLTERHLQLLDQLDRHFPQDSLLEGLRQAKRHNFSEA